MIAILDVDDALCEAASRGRLCAQIFGKDAADDVYFLLSLNYSFIGYCFGSILHSDSDRYKKLEEEHGALDLWSAAGMSLWLIGMGGNAWHHWLLARARKGKQYVKLSSIGGLFREALPCPHYLFECVAWLGYALVGKSSYHYLTVIFFGTYLSGRSAKTLQWYRKKDLL